VERFTGSSECQEYKWLNLFYKYSDSRLNSKIGNGDGALTIVKMQNTHLRDEPTAMVAAANPPTVRRDLRPRPFNSKMQFFIFSSNTTHISPPVEKYCPTAFPTLVAIFTFPPSLSIFSLHFDVRDRCHPSPQGSPRPPSPPLLQTRHLRDDVIRF
jgi:hypothetical protein